VNQDSSYATLVLLGGADALDGEAARFDFEWVLPLEKLTGRMKSR